MRTTTDDLYSLLIYLIEYFLDESVSCLVHNIFPQMCLLISCDKETNVMEAGYSAVSDVGQAIKDMFLHITAVFNSF